MSRVWQIFAEFVAILQIHKLKTPSATLGSFANQNLVRFASFARTCYAKIFSSISDWQKYLLKILHRKWFWAALLPLLARGSPWLETDLQILVFKLQIYTLAGCWHLPFCGKRLLVWFGSVHTTASFAQRCKIRPEFANFLHRPEQKAPPFSGWINCPKKIYWIFLVHLYS